MLGSLPQFVPRGTRHETGHISYEREAPSAWAATAIVKLHVKLILGARESEHTLTIEEPPSEDHEAGELPLV